MKPERTRSKTILLFSVGLIFGTVLSYSAIAEAGTAYGLFGYYGPQLGYSYKNQNRIVTTSSTAQGSTFATVTAGGSAPAGYIGIKARSFKGGSLCRYTGWNYNSSPTTSAGWSTSSSPCGTGIYAAQGDTQAWTGQSYNTYGTFVTQSQNYPG